MTISKKNIKYFLKQANEDVKTLTLKIPIHMHHIVLAEAGYFPHKDHGWIKNASTKKKERRFHVVSLTQDMIEIHCDTTVETRKRGPLHVVKPGRNLLAIELGNIKKAWHRYDPVYQAKLTAEKNKPVMRLKSHRGEFAPNLAQIQRNPPPIILSRAYIPEKSYIIKVIHRLIAFLKTIGGILHL